MKTLSATPHALHGYLLGIANITEFKREKRKSCESCDAGDETAPRSGAVREGGNSSNCDRHDPETAAVDGEDGDDEMEQSGLPSKYEAHPPHDNNAEGRGVAAGEWRRGIAR